MGYGLWVGVLLLLWNIVAPDGGRIYLLLFLKLVVVVYNDIRYKLLLQKAIQYI
jgi:hypothetical protein